MSTAGPPVAKIESVPPAPTVTVPALLSRNAAFAPLVVRLMSATVSSPRAMVPVVLTSDRPPDPELVTVISSKVLVPRAVPVRSSALALWVVTEMVPVGCEHHGAGVVEPDADVGGGGVVGVAVVDGEVGDVEGAGGGVELETGLGAAGAGVLDEDVVDGAAAGVAGGAGDAAAGALGVDDEPADGGVVVEVDDVGVVVGQRRPGRRRRRSTGCRTPTTRLAASLVSTWLALRLMPAA